jgi:hypothetical protein
MPAEAQSGGTTRRPRRRNKVVTEAHPNKFAFLWLTEHGYSAAAAAGIVGNLIQESGVNPKSNQEGGPGRGIAQWSEGERWDTLLQWTQQKGLDPLSLSGQLAFLDHEMKINGWKGQMAGTNDVATAANQFMTLFERPDPQYANLQNRVTQALQLFNNSPTGRTDPQSGTMSGDMLPRVPGGALTRDGGGRDGNVADRQRQQDQPDYGNYGYVKAFTEAHPEIANLIDQARQQGWEPSKLEFAIKETKWWQNLTKSQKQWSILTAEQPAEAKLLTQKAEEAIRAAAVSAGVSLSRQELNHLAEKAARNGWDEADVALAVAHRFDLPKKGGEIVGTAGQAADIIAKMTDDYGVPVDRATREKWIKQTLAGQLDPSTMEDHLREQAKILYAPVAKQLDTRTVRELLSPYLTMAADELGITVDQMRTTDGKWTRALTSGKAGQMSVDEWTSMIRSDKSYEWDKGPAARAYAAQLGGALARAMGAPV